MTEQALLRSLARRGDWEAALGVFGKLRKAERADCVTATLTLAACAKARVWEPAIALSQREKPDAHFVSAAITCFARAGKWVHALEMFQRHPRGVARQAALACLPWEFSLKLLDSRRSDEQPSWPVPDCERTMAACLRDGQWNKVLSLFNACRDHASVILTNGAISACVGRPALARQLLGGLPEPNSRSYGAALRVQTSASQIFSLVEDMERSNAANLPASQRGSALLVEQHCRRCGSICKVI